GRVRAKVIAGSADRIDQGLRRIQEPEAVRPSVVVRAAVRILLRERESIGRVVGRPRAALVFAVLRDEQSALQRMIVRGESDAIRIAVAPRDRLDGRLGILGVQLRPQDRTVAYAMPRRRVESRDVRAGTLRAMRRVSAAEDASAAVGAVARTGWKEILAQHDVLTRNVLLTLAASVVEPDDAR